MGRKISEDKPFMPWIRGRMRLILPAVILSLPALALSSYFVWNTVNPKSDEEKAMIDSVKVTASCEPDSRGSGTHAQIVIEKSGDPGKGLYIVNWGPSAENYYTSNRPLRDRTEMNFEINRPAPGTRLVVYAGIPSEIQPPASSPPQQVNRTPLRKGKELGGITIPAC